MGSANLTRSRRYELALAFFLAASLAATFAVPPIPQDPGYHAFADDRAFFGIPNLLNVASNLPFLLIGASGLLWLVSGRRSERAQASWASFFAGAALVTFGSAYYHYNPSDQTLIWDRLAMSVAFMGLISALVTE